MKTNEIPPRTLIELCNNVQEELESVLEDFDYVGDDDGTKRVNELINELSFVREISIKRLKEFINDIK